MAKVGFFRATLAKLKGKKDDKNELFKKVRTRRGEEEPESSTTAQIIENGHQGTSDMSMDSENELEENFFTSNWSEKVPSKRPKTSAGVTEGGIDLNVISSTSSLNTDVQRHKIKVKQSGKRVTSQFAQKRRTQAPTSPLAGSMKLPEVKEESPPKDSPKVSSKKTKDPKPEIKSPKPSKTSQKAKDSPKVKPKTIVVDKKPNSKPTSPVSPLASPKLPESAEKEKTADKDKPQVVEDTPKVAETKSVKEKNKPVEEESKPVIKVENKPPKVENKPPKEENTAPKEESKPKVEEKPKEPVVHVAVVEEKRTSDPKPSEKVKFKEEPAKDKEEDKKASGEPSVTEVKTETKGVVLRRKPESQVSSPSTSKVDASKRQTIAGPGFVSGQDKKAGKRSSAYEPRDWSELDKPKDKAEDTPANEFSQMFNKFKRSESKRKTSLVQEDERSPVTVFNKGLGDKAPKSPDRPTSPAERPSSPEKLDRPKSSEKAVSPDSHTKEKDTKGATKTAVIATTSSTSKTDSKSVILTKQLSKDNTEQKHTSGGKESEKVDSNKSSDKVAGSKPKEEKKSVTIEKSESIKIKNNTAVSSRSVTIEDKRTDKSSKPDSPESSKANIDNNNKLAPSKTDSSNGGNQYKKASPLPKNRARSQTLPEQPVTKEILDSPQKSSDKSQGKESEKVDSSSGSSKKDTTGKSDPSPASSQRKPVVRSASQRVEPKKLALQSSKDSGGGGQPSWVAMAMKKTTNWDGKEKDLSKLENKNNEKTEKDTEQDEKENDAKEETPVIHPEATSKLSRGAPNRSSKVMDLCKRFQ